MTPSQALTHLEHILILLDRMMPGFHTELDRSDLHEARFALDDVARRLARDIAKDEAYFEANPPPA